MKKNKERVLEILKQIDNSTFDDHEGSIEHIDMDIDEFISLLKELAELNGAVLETIKR